MLCVDPLKHPGWVQTELAWYSSQAGPRSQAELPSSAGQWLSAGTQLTLSFEPGHVLMLFSLSHPREERLSLPS